MSTYLYVESVLDKQFSVLPVSCFKDLVAELSTPAVIQVERCVYEADKDAHRDKKKVRALTHADMDPALGMDRKRELTVGASLLCVDVDNSEHARLVLDPVDIDRRLDGLSWCAYHTASSTIDNPRVRIIVDANIRYADFTEKPEQVFSAAMDSLLEMLGLPPVVPTDVKPEEKHLYSVHENKNRIGLSFWPSKYIDDPADYQPVYGFNVDGHAFNREHIARKWLARHEIAVKTKAIRDLAAVAKTAYVADSSNETEKVKSALSFISPDLGHEDGWLEIGMALHHWSKGSEEGLKLFTDWSLTSTVHCGTPEKADKAVKVCEDKWKSFKRGEGDNVTGIGSLFKRAIDAGWVHISMVGLDDKYTCPVLNKPWPVVETPVATVAGDAGEPDLTITLDAVPSDDAQASDASCGKPYIDKLPGVLADIVNESAECNGVPEAVQLTACLAAIQCVVKAWVRVSMADGRTPVPALSNWLICGGRGIGKTTAVNSAMGALKAEEDYEHDRRRINSGVRKIAKARLKKIEDAMSKELKDGNSDASMIAEYNDAVKYVREMEGNPAFTESDITPEAASQLIAKWEEINGPFGSVYLHSDDAKVLLPAIIKDAYKDTSMLAGMILNGHMGWRMSSKRVGRDDYECKLAYMHFYASCTYETFAKFAECDSCDENGLHRRTHMLKLPEMAERTSLSHLEASLKYGKVRPAKDAWDLRMQKIITWAKSRKVMTELNLTYEQKLHIFKQVEKYEKHLPGIDAWFGSMLIHTGAIIATLHVLNEVETGISYKVSDTTIDQALWIVQWLAESRIGMVREKLELERGGLGRKILERIDRYKGMNDYIERNGRMLKAAPLSVVRHGLKVKGKKSATNEDILSVLPWINRSVADVNGVKYII